MLICTMAHLVPFKTLNNGQKIPVLGLGTSQGQDDPTKSKEAVKIAIDLGYRLFDCSPIFGNEHNVGEALDEKISCNIVKREDLFIVTKVWNSSHEEYQVEKSLKKSLEALQLNYVDLFLIQWPVSDSNDIDFLETWRGMERCVKFKLTNGIGLSNFNHKQINRIIKYAKIKPVVNQVECHVNLNQKKLREFCKEKDIVLMAYSPFGAPNEPTDGPYSGWKSPEKVVLDVSELKQLGSKYEKSEYQIALRYLIDIGTIPIPKSSSERNISANIDIFDFKLTEEEKAKIDKLDCGKRTSTASQYKKFDYYPFDAEF